MLTDKEESAPKQVWLASPGGNVMEALQMAEVIRGLKASVTVEPSMGNCASACVFLYLAGTERTAWGRDERAKKPGGHLGLHRPYLAPIGPHVDVDTEQLQRTQRQMMKMVSAYLSDQMVPQRLIDEMMSRSSRDMYWASAEDLRQLGAMQADVEEVDRARCPRKSEGKLTFEEFACITVPRDQARKRFMEALHNGWS